MVDCLCLLLDSPECPYITSFYMCYYNCRQLTIIVIKYLLIFSVIYGLTDQNIVSDNFTDIHIDQWFGKKLKD